MHQGWPKFAASLWMATNDNGLAVVAYSPSIVKAKVGKGTEVTITEVTEYPFKGDIMLKINSPGSVRFPLYLRVPGWSDPVNFNFRGRTITGIAGETVRLEEKWEDGDQITFRLPMEIRFEKRYNNSVSVLRGPLYFSLRIDKEFNSIKLNYDNFGYKGSVDWEIRPKSSWNYGLMIDNINPDRGFKVAENPLTTYPFADKGDMVWSADSAKYMVWDKEAPVVITTRGMTIPGWSLKDNSADIPPVSPVMADSTPEVIQLVPYGSARLRITEFPVIDLTHVVDVMRPGN